MAKLILCKQKLEEGTCKRGFILITVMVITMVLLALSFSLVKAITSELIISRSQKAGTICFYLAEAGIKEAIWRVKNDPGARDKFINSENGLTTFEHNPALIENGSYSVQIQNTAKGAAEITSTGFYNLASDIKAQRVIKVEIAQATSQSPLTDVAAFSGGASGNEDIRIAAANVRVINGSMISNRNIDIWLFGNVNVDKDVKAVRDIRVWPFSNLTAGGQIIEGISPLEMPLIDFDSADPNSLKSLAAAQGQVFTRQQLRNMLLNNPNLVLNGYIYVTGTVDIQPWQTLTVNGVLAADGAVTVGHLIFSGSLTVNHPEGQKSGIFSKQSLVIKGGGKANINGLIYIGDRIDIDASMPNNTIVVNGALYARRMYIWGFRTVNITQNNDYVNELIAPVFQTPVIEIQHWEEEY